MTRRAVAAIAIITTSPSYIIAACNHSWSASLTQFVLTISSDCYTNLPDQHWFSCSEKSQQDKVDRESSEEKRGNLWESENQYVVSSTYTLRVLTQAMAMMMAKLPTAETPKATQYIVVGWCPCRKMPLCIKRWKNILSINWNPLDLITLVESHDTSKCQ